MLGRALRGVFSPRISETHFMAAIFTLAAGMIINANVFIKDAGDALRKGFASSIEYSVGMSVCFLAVFLLCAYVFHIIRKRTEKISLFVMYWQGVVYYSVMAVLAILASPYMTYGVDAMDGGKFYALNGLVINFLNVIYAVRFIWVYFSVVTQSRKSIRTIVGRYADARITKWHLRMLIVVGLCGMVILKAEQYSVPVQMYLTINYSLSILGIVHHLTHLHLLQFKLKRPKVFFGNRH